VGVAGDVPDEGPQEAADHQRGDGDADGEVAPDHGLGSDRRGVGRGRRVGGAPVLHVVVGGGGVAAPSVAVGGAEGAASAGVTGGVGWVGSVGSDIRAPGWWARPAEIDDGAVDG